MMENKYAVNFVKTYKAGIEKMLFATRKAAEEFYKSFKAEFKFQPAIVCKAEDEVKLHCADKIGIRICLKVVETEAAA